MFSYKIGIFGADLYYSMKLMEYFNVHEHIPFKVSVFSSISAVREYLEQHSLDLLLIDYGDSDCECRIPTIRLCEYKDMEGCIFKYQNVELIATELMNYLGRNSISRLEKELWIAVYSPLGRCGKTTLSKNLANHFEHSLYVGLEDFPYPSDEAARKAGETFLYYLAGMNDKVLDVIADSGTSDAYAGDSLVATVCHMERRVSFQSLKWFKELLTERKHYGAVVFDLGISTLESLELFSLFDKVIVPVVKEEHSSLKIRYFDELVKKTGDRELIEKIKYIYFSKKDFDEGCINEMIEKGAI